jgi:hypothetical protein
MILYQLWLARNNARDDAKVVELEVIVRRSTFLVNEWLEIQAHQHKISVPSEEKHGLPLEQGWCKVNVDGAFSTASGNGGCGVVPLQGKQLLPAHQIWLLPAHLSPPVRTGR